MFPVVANVIVVICRGGSRPQFWEEPTTKKIMNAIRSKKMEMKAAAEILGVSYSTLYSRYREVSSVYLIVSALDCSHGTSQLLMRADSFTVTRLS